MPETKINGALMADQAQTSGAGYSGHARGHGLSGRLVLGAQTHQRSADLAGNGRLDADDASVDRAGRGPGVDEDGRYSLPSDE